MPIRKCKNNRTTLADITLIGCGLKKYDQLTFEARRMLRTARCIFYSAVNGKVPKSLRPAAERVVNIEEKQYLPGMYRPTMYQNMARTVIAEAQRAPGVAVLQPGSALLVDTITHQIIQMATKTRLSVEIIPGISCVETVLAQLGYAVFDGLQITFAQKLLLHSQTLNPGIASLIIQPGYYDTRWWAGAARSQPDRFVQLQHYLLRFFPLTSEIALVLTPMRNGSGSVFWLTLDDLPQIHRLLSPLHTLFIPPVESPTLDDNFEASIDSWESTLNRFALDSTGQPHAEGETYWFGNNMAELPARLVAQSEAIAQRWEASRLNSQT